jgi:hypothetical protein
MTPVRVNLQQGGLYQLVMRKPGYLEHRAELIPRIYQQIVVPLQLTDAGRGDLMLRTEWFGFEVNLGGGSDAQTVLFGGHILAFTLKWRHFFWTINEAGGIFNNHGGGGLFGTRFGVPFFFGSLGQHSFRIGLGFSFAGFHFDGSHDSLSRSHQNLDSSGLGLSPTIEYRYVGRRLFLGGGLRALILAAGEDNSHPWYVVAAFQVGWARRADY